jgi:sec-independent protein translocase protein TatC
MTVLDHLDELRSRLFRVAIAYVIAMAACWSVSDRALVFLLRPIRQHLYQGEDITFINITEPFLIYVKASALFAVFLAAPYILYEMWAFISPGLYAKERRLAWPFLVFGSLSFFAGGAFGYYAAVPQASAWLIGLGEPFRASITLRSAFTFESRIILAMGAVFEMPILIFFLSRIGLVTPRFLMRHFKLAVLVMAVVAAVLTPSGDMMTMMIFVGPMVLLYLIGVAVAWLATPRETSRSES